MKRVLLFIGLAIGLAGGAAVLSLSESYRGFQPDLFVRVQRGAGTASIARTLEQAGAIRYAWQFDLERALRPRATLQAGEYRFTKAATVHEVFSRLARGDIYYMEIMVKEGSNMYDIGRAVENAGVMAADDFVRAAGDPSSIRDLDPHAPTLEGYLFPSTYRVSRSTTPAELCSKMTEQFRKQWKKLAAGRQVNVHRTITLASLVEKETGIPSERPLVAGVFTNRLERGMRLECDPTTIYAALVENRYRNAIHRSDLASHNPYNTYQNAGLPPGPIANPGADSIAAALEPAETAFLFFVAKPGGGGHQFSSTLDAHHKATREYRGESKKPKKARKAA